jgi:hypothetical protein
MGFLSRLLRNSEDNGLIFWCPGCKESHQVMYGAGNGPRWNWNGNVDKPTFTPSILVRTGHYCQRPGVDSCWCTWNAENPDDLVDFKCMLCHSYITDGNIQFLNDCTHELAGQTVPLPTYPGYENL